jgi:Ni/Co efflux regulator RcnB
MKKLLSLLVSAAFIAMPLATLSAPAAAATPSIQAQAEKKDMGDKPKATKAKAKKAGKKKMAKKKAA